MIFEAILFLSGAVLFFLTALFFVFLWQDRTSLVRRKAEMERQVEELERQASALKEQRVDMDIWEHELKVWAEGLEYQQAAIAQAQEELRMLTATKAPVAALGLVSSDAVLRDGGINQPSEQVKVKNEKRQADGAKLSK